MKNQILLILTIMIVVVQHAVSIPVYWRMEKTPARFGNLVKLTCMVNKTENCDSTATRRWDGGLYNSLIMLNGHSSNASKYYEITDEPCIQFSLVIMDFGIFDVNCQYWCSFGFETSRQKLNLDEEHFIKEPDWHNVELSQKETTLHVRISFYMVYPRPKCKIKLGDIDWIRDETLPVYQSGMFFNAALYRKTTVHIDQCHHSLTINCTILSYIILKLDQRLNCTEKVFNGSKPSMETTIILAVTVFVCTAILLATCRSKRLVNSYNSCNLYLCAVLANNKLL